MPWRVQNGELCLANFDDVVIRKETIDRWQCSNSWDAETFALHRNGGVQFLVCFVEHDRSIGVQLLQIFSSSNVIEMS